MGLFAETTASWQGPDHIHATKLFIPLKQGVHMQRLIRNAPLLMITLQLCQELFGRLLDGPFGPKSMVAIILK